MAAEPLYRRVFDVLHQRIVRGDYPPGALIASEPKLMKEFGVSRITVRRAVDELARRGLVQKQQGRGTLVADYRPQVSLGADIEGLVENNRRMARQTQVRLLAADYVAADDDVARALDLASGSVVQRAVRVRSFGGYPFSYIITYLPKDIGRTFAIEELSHLALIDLLERNGIEIAHAEQEITAEGASADVGRALGVPENAPLLRSSRVVSDASDRKVQFIIALYRPDIYRYRVSMRRIGRGANRRWSR